MKAARRIQDAWVPTVPSLDDVRSFARTPGILQFGSNRKGCAIHRAIVTQQIGMKKCKLPLCLTGASRSAEARKKSPLSRLAVGTPLISLGACSGGKFDGEFVSMANSLCSEQERRTIGSNGDSAQASGSKRLTSDANKSLSTTRVQSQTQVEHGAYSCSVLSSPDEIRALKPFVGCSIARDDVLFDPKFFLSSVSSGWEPRVAAVYNEARLAGVVYAKEKTILGCHFGVLYADLSWGSLSFGDYIHQENTFRIARENLLASPGTRGMRLRILRGSPELAAIRKLIVSKNLDVHFSWFKDHASLTLPDTYEQLLKSFGSTTRHNFRYYRRRFEAAGHVYLECLSLDELRSAAVYLKPRCTIPGPSESVERLWTWLLPRIGSWRWDSSIETVNG